MRAFARLLIGLRAVISLLGCFRAFGPGLAATTLIAVLVAMTLVPALLALFGHAPVRRERQALAASDHARRHGVPKHLMSGLWGHGLGLGFEPPWFGPHSADVLIGSDGPEVLTDMCAL